MAESMTDTYVGLGGNEDDVLAAFRRALTGLADRGVTVVAVSRAYRTVALMPSPDVEPGPDYWNAVAHLRTGASPQALLGWLQDLEREAGRERRERWAPRPLDLDLLLYGEQVVAEPQLRVPHPALGQRVFVLRPLLELAPEARVPPDMVTVVDLLAAHKNPDAGVEYVLDGWR